MVIRRSIAALAAVMLLAGCGSPPSSPAASGNIAATGTPETCAEDLPRRTSPTDYPVAVLHLAGDDLPPVVGDVEWRGGDEPTETTAARAPHLQRFTVLQATGRNAFGIRMTDGVQIDAWEVWAVPNQSFRSGDYETGRVVWSEGTGPESVVCVPVDDGQWLVAADLTYADGAGEGTFYWRLNVVETPGA